MKNLSNLHFYKYKIWVSKVKITYVIPKTILKIQPNNNNFLKKNLGLNKFLWLFNKSNQHNTLKLVGAYKLHKSLIFIFMKDQGYAFNYYV